MGLQIFANIDATQLNTARVVSANDLRPKKFKPLAAGDSTVVDLFLTGDSGLQNIQDYPTVRLGIGNLNARPEGGTWDYGSQTGLAYDVSAGSLQSAIIAEGGAACTVTELTPFVFKVAFSANGAQTIATVDSSGLSPSSSVSIVKLVEGDASTKEQWLVRLFANPIALVETFSDISGNGIRGSLSLGTEGVYDLLSDNNSAQTTIELELTDADGNIQTIFQVPLTISGEVIGQGAGAVASFSSFATASQIVNAATRSDYIIVSAADGSDTSGLREREDRPFATPSGAVAVATANDVIVIRDGDFSNQQITLPDSVTIAANPSSIGPICVTTATRQAILIGPFSGLTHAGHGTVTLNGVDMNFVEVTATGGELSVLNSNLHARDIDTKEAVDISDLGSAASVRFDNCRITNDQEDYTVKIANLSGSVFFSDCEVKNIKATATHHPLVMTGTATGTLQLKDCTFVNENENGTISGLSAPNKTVRVQGVVNMNSGPDTYIDFEGGMLSIDSNYDI